MILDLWLDIDHKSKITTMWRAPGAGQRARDAAGGGHNRRNVAVRVVAFRHHDRDGSHDLPAVPHRRGDRCRDQLDLTAGDRHSCSTHLGKLAAQPARVGERPLGICSKRAGEHPLEQFVRRMRQQHPADARRVERKPAAHPGHDVHGVPP